MKCVAGKLKAWLQRFVGGHKEMQEMKKGLFIGINDYQFINPLGGCINDAIAMASVLERHGSGSPNFSNKVLTTPDINLSKKALERQIRELFSGEAGVALLYFAGHGHFDTSIDEGTLLPQDFEADGDGIRISDILRWAGDAKSIQNKIIILDCCQAGAAGESRQLRGGDSVLGEGVTILTACKKDQTADETNGHGIFTRLLLQGLYGGGANVLGKISPGALYSFVDGALGPWDQRPVFKTNVSSFCALKEMEPLIPLDTLRKLAEWFPEPESTYSLTPAHEPTEETFDEALGEIFAQLQKCNRHSLVEPVDEEHMYYAAVKSTGCRLTAMGAYYRQLAMEGRI